MSYGGSGGRQILRDGSLLEAYVAALPLARLGTRGCLSCRLTVILSDGRNIWSSGRKNASCSQNALC